MRDNRQRWWAQGLAYGPGAWLAAPWFALFVFRLDGAWAEEAVARIIFLALPLAFAASWAGATWRRAYMSVSSGSS
ncbi:MAG TPA: hypothetical protein VF808_10850 [Ktedonobacterales bacterium]